MEHSTSAVNWQPVNLAKAPGQLIRNSPGPPGPRRRRHRVLPVAGLARRRREVPLRPGPARRHRHQGLARGRRARRDPGPARRGAAARRCRPGWRSSSTTTRSGPSPLTGHPSAAGRLRRRAAALVRRVLGRRHHRRRRPRRRRPLVVRRGRRALPLHLHRRAGGEHRGGRRGRGAGRRHLLLRHRRRARPRPARRLPGRVPRPARRAGRGVLPAARAARRSSSTTGRPARSGPSCCTARTPKTVATYDGRAGRRRARRHPARGRDRARAWYVATSLAAGRRRRAGRRRLSRRRARAAARRARPASRSSAAPATAGRTCSCSTTPADPVELRRRRVRPAAQSAGRRVPCVVEPWGRRR